MQKIDLNDNPQPENSNSAEEQASTPKAEQSTKSQAETTKVEADAEATAAAANSQTDSGVDEEQEISDNQNSESSPLKELDLESRDNMSKKGKRIFTIISVAAILAGAATGIGAYRVYHQGSTAGPGKKIEQVPDNSIKAGDVFGIEDEETFPNTAQGYLEAGGIDGEGSHRLLREGGPSQTVYLTSSITDLDKMVGMEVKVWGETYKGQKAGWLMDVGKVKVVDPKAQPPEGEEL